jgi:hypothetical protein
MKVKANTNGNEHTSTAENKMQGVFGRQQFNNSTRLAWLESLVQYARKLLANLNNKSGFRSVISRIRRRFI